MNDVDYWCIFVVVRFYCYFDCHHWFAVEVLLVLIWSVSLLILPLVAIIHSLCYRLLLLLSIREFNGILFIIILFVIILIIILVGVFQGALRLKVLCYA